MHVLQLELLAAIGGMLLLMYLLRIRRDRKKVSRQVNREYRKPARVREKHAA